jgi:PAS domain S-box-containing protein
MLQLLKKRNYLKFTNRRHILKLPSFNAILKGEIDFKPKSISMKIALLYIFAGCLWILLSDTGVFLFVRNKNTVELINTLKGWFYILVTGIILYYLIYGALNRIYSTGKELKQNYNKLSVAYEELRASNEQLSAYEEELQRQFHEMQMNQNALRESEERFRATFEQVAVGISHTTLDNKFIRFNQKFCDMLGYTQNELSTKTFLEITHEDDLQNNLDCLKKLSNAETSTCSIEKRYIRKDRSIVWANLTISLVSDSSGMKPYFITIIEDISKRKKVEEALIENKERFRNVLEHSQDAAYRRNFVNNKYDYISPVIKSITGYSSDEMESMSMEEVLSNMHPEDLPKVLEAMEETSLVEKEIATSIEYRILCKDGKYHWINDRFTTVNKPSSQPLFRYGVIEDITERKEMITELRVAKEKAEEASNIKSEFLTNISHELRTPLNVILGAIQLFGLYLNGDIISNKDKIIRHTKSMKQNCLRLLRMVNNIIDTTKIDVGFYECHQKPYNIVAVVEQITLSVSEFARLKYIDLSFYSDIKERIILCDVDMIERIILNLLSNAIKFTRQNGTINVSIFEGIGNIFISVKDNGIGIKKEKQLIVFDRFKQGTDLLTREHEGSGIGLSLSKSLIELHGGNISVNSEYGNGSEFVVELPVKTSLQKIPDQSNTNYASSNKLIERMNIEFSDIYI